MSETEGSSVSLPAEHETSLATPSHPSWQPHAQGESTLSTDVVPPTDLGADSSAPAAKRRNTEIASSSIGLTYSQCEASTASYLEWLTAKPWFRATDQYVIAREAHAEGGHHLHVAIKRPGKGQFRFKGANAMLVFDYDYEGNIYHPNIITNFRKGYEAWSKYCQKDGDYISNGLGTPSVWHQIAGKDWDQARPLLLEGAPRDLFLNADRIKSNISLVNAPVIERVVYSGPFLSSFYPGPEFLPSRQSLVITGSPGIGKTQFACFCASASGDFLIATHMDDLKKLSSAHKTIVFDDMSFNHLPRETSIFITDIEMPRSIHCRYGNAIIPAGVKRIFTSNRRAFQPHLNLEPLFVSDPAVERRVYEHVIQ